MRAAFEAEHERRYGWREPHAEVEVVTVRVAAVDPGPAVDLAAGGAPAGPVTGPAVLHLPETTVVVPAGWAGRHDAAGTLVLERAA
ncbi:MAG: hypothetical protein MUC84_04985 [Solirubrobacteraceae bacterium]|nr:hypothetical protein [Solirubrobacteraceae bacterium]